jgi:hypothetical protein
MREVSTDEPCGFGIVGDASSTINVVLLKDWRFDKASAVDTDHSDSC